MDNFQLEVITPERRFFKDEVESVTVRTLSGKIQILKNHMSFAAGLLPDVIKIKQRDGSKYAVISGGFFKFDDNKALILADSAEWPEEIDLHRAEEALDRARARLEAKEGNIDKKRAKMALMRATERLKAAQIKRK